MAKRYGVNPKTIAKWKRREFTSDARMGPKNPCPSTLTRNDQAIICIYRWRTRLSLNDLHVRLKRLMPKLSRSALYRCLKRGELNKIGRTTKCSPLTSGALNGPYWFEITTNEVHVPDEVVIPIFLAVEEVTKYVYGEVAKPYAVNAAAFVDHLVAAFPRKIQAVTTEVEPVFTNCKATFGENFAAVSSHPFAVACRAHRIVHTRTISSFSKTHSAEDGSAAALIHSPDDPLAVRFVPQGAFRVSQRHILRSLCP